MFFKKKALPLQCNKTNEGTRKGTEGKDKKIKDNKNKRQSFERSSVKSTRKN